MEKTQGWECPCCHATYAPWVSRCQRCYEAGEQDKALDSSMKDYALSVKPIIGDTVFIPMVDSSGNHSFKEIRPITMPKDGETTRGFAGEA